MLRIGLTGGIGAGKSTASRLLERLGARIIDADALAREVVEPGRPALAELVDAFGQGILTDAGELDRPALAALAFATREDTARLNGIMHPAIGRLTQERFAEHADAAVVVHDVPLLVENGGSANYHLCLLVDAAAETRLERLTQSRGMDRADAQRRIDAQATDAQRYAACDLILDNNGAPQALEEAVSEAWETRLAPFAENLRAGVPARQPSGGESSMGESAVESAVGWHRESAEHASARIGARLRRAAGEGAEVEVGTDVRLATIRVAEAGRIDAVTEAVAAAGYPPADEDATSSADGGVRVLASADPGCPMRVEIRAEVS